MVKIVYACTDNYDQSIPNNGFPEETESIVTDGVYDFECFLQDNGIQFEREGDIYYAVEHGERTGRVWFVMSEKKIEVFPEDDEVYAFLEDYARSDILPTMTRYELVKQFFEWYGEVNENHLLMIDRLFKNKVITE